MVNLERVSNVHSNRILTTTDLRTTGGIQRLRVYEAVVLSGDFIMTPLQSDQRVFPHVEARRERARVDVDMVAKLRSGTWTSAGTRVKDANSGRRPIIRIPVFAASRHIEPVSDLVLGVEGYRRVILRVRGEVIRSKKPAIIHGAHVNLETKAQRLMTKHLRPRARDIGNDDVRAIVPRSGAVRTAPGRISRRIVAEKAADSEVEVAERPVGRLRVNPIDSGELGIGVAAARNARKGPGGVGTVIIRAVDQTHRG